MEKLQGFDVPTFLAAVFRRYSDEDIEKQFVVGTPETTPQLSEVSTAWPQPWAFSCLLVLSISCFAAFWWGWLRFQNTNLIPGWILTGSFAIPISVLVFFLEMNVLRNISSYRVMKLLFGGGILALIITLFLDEWIPNLGQSVVAMIAGPIEETAKLLAVIYFTRNWKIPWILSGMLCGAAVGTGFSALESAGYVMTSLLKEAMGQDYTNADLIIVLRAALSPFTHTLWTAIAAAAFWSVKGSRPFAWGMFLHPSFLRIFAFSVGLHVLWNSPLTVPFLGGVTAIIARGAALGACGWILVLMLAQKGLQEVKTAQGELPMVNGNSGAIAT